MYEWVGVESRVPVELLDVLAVVALVASQTKETLLQDRVVAVPQREREAHALQLVADAGDAVLVPAVGARAGRVVRQVTPTRCPRRCSPRARYPRRGRRRTDPKPPAAAAAAQPILLDRHLPLRGRARDSGRHRQDHIGSRRRNRTPAGHRIPCAAASPGTRVAFARDRVATRFDHVGLRRPRPGAPARVARDQRHRRLRVVDDRRPRHAPLPRASRPRCTRPATATFCSPSSRRRSWSGRAATSCRRTSIPGRSTRPASLCSASSVSTRSDVHGPSTVSCLEGRAAGARREHRRGDLRAAPRGGRRAARRTRWSASRCGR